MHDAQELLSAKGSNLGEQNKGHHVGLSDALGTLSPKGKDGIPRKSAKEVVHGESPGSLLFKHLMIAVPLLLT